MRYYFILLLILFIGCSATDDDPSVSASDDATTIHVDLNEAEPIYMSEFFSDLNYFYLETPEERPIGQIWKIMFQRDYVALYDRARGSIWVYTKNGKYVNEINISQGRGPGELENISDVYFDDDLQFHVMGQFKIVIYDIEAQVLDEIEYRFFVYNFMYNDNTEEYIGNAGNSLNQGTLNNNHGGRNLLYFDKNGAINKSFLPIGKGKEQMGFGIPNNFPVYNDNQLYIPHLADTIYALNSENISARYIIDFGKHSIPNEAFDRRENYNNNIHDWSNFLEKEITEPGYASFISVFAESDSLIYFNFDIGDNPHEAFYQKTNGITRVGPAKMINDIDFGLSSFIYEGDGNDLYTIIDANNLFRHLNDLYENDPEKYNNPKMKQLIDLSHTIDGNRNPILMKASYK